MLYIYSILNDIHIYVIAYIYRLINILLRAIMNNRTNSKKTVVAAIVDIESTTRKRQCKQDDTTPVVCNPYDDSSGSRVIKRNKSTKNHVTPMKRIYLEDVYGDDFEVNESINEFTDRLAKEEAIRDEERERQAELAEKRNMKIFIDSKLMIDYLCQKYSRSYCTDHLYMAMFDKLKYEMEDIMKMIDLTMNRWKALELGEHGSSTDARRMIRLLHGQIAKANGIKNHFSDIYENYNTKILKKIEHIKRNARIEDVTSEV